MANAIPVYSKPAKAAKDEIEYILPEGSPMKLEEFKAEVARLIAAEVPTHITDKQVNEIGQAHNYGKVRKAELVLIPIFNAMGEKVKDSVSIRLEH